MVKTSKKPRKVIQQDYENIHTSAIFVPNRINPKQKFKHDECDPSAIDIFKKLGFIK